MTNYLELIIGGLGAAALGAFILKHLKYKRLATQAKILDMTKNAKSKEVALRAELVRLEKKKASSEISAKEFQSKYADLLARAKRLRGE